MLDRLSVRGIESFIASDKAMGTGLLGCVCIVLGSLLRKKKFWCGVGCRLLSACTVGIIQRGEKIEKEVMGI